MGGNNFDWFSFVKRHYEAGRFKKDNTRDDVRIFVKAGKITPEQYKEITGFDYEISSES